MEINDGEFVFIVGPSGAGKSTLTKLLTAELRPASGSLLVNGFSVGSMKRREIPALRRTMGVVYQDFKLIERMTIFDNVAFAMHVVGEHDKNKIRERVLYVLKLVGLEGKHDRRPNQLSGGEQQRAVIARAIVNNPGMIIADEPTGNLDPVRSFEIMELLVKINEMGSTVVVITHERELVDSFSKRVILISEGRVAGDRESGYVGSMVSDGSELGHTTEFFRDADAAGEDIKETVFAEDAAAVSEVVSENEAPGAEEVSEPENQSEAPSEDAEVKDFELKFEEAEVFAAEEEGTKFYSAYSADENTSGFMFEFLSAVDSTDGDSDADEDTLMAILGDDAEDAPSPDNTAEEGDGE